MCSGFATGGSARAVRSADDGHAFPAASPTANKIPRARFNFGARVLWHWHEVECGPSETTITGVNFDHRRDTAVTYTITEDNGQQTTEIEEGMLTLL